MTTATSEEETAREKAQYFFLEKSRRDPAGDIYESLNMQCSGYIMPCGQAIIQAKQAQYCTPHLLGAEQTATVGETQLTFRSIREGDEVLTTPQKMILLANYKVLSQQLELLLPQIKKFATEML